MIGQDGIIPGLFRSPYATPSISASPRGAPRDGDLLLHGIAWCARCGHKMYVRYKGGGQYVCNHLRSTEGLPACQFVRAARVDAAVADAFLAALAPAEVDALSRARRAQLQVDTALRASADRQL